MPKSIGSWSLHCADAQLPLEARILFSSVASAFGNVGQASYAAANAGLDSQALSRRVRGLAVCSVQWPAVGGAGMGAHAVATLAERRFAFTGLASISLEEYAACVRGHLVPCCGASCSTRTEHRADVQELLRDLADASRPHEQEVRNHTRRTCARTHRRIRSRT